ncbi:MAG: electron transfer flavoprotein subunit alpha [Gammaproteobacteria bacterium]|nr:MAG: electron transfer flavoprotein subunit alpha [Gammaproteobacteria bacterium]
MTRVLVLAEHHHGQLAQASLCAISAGGSLGAVDVLVAGEGVAAVAQQAAALEGVATVLHAEHAAYADSLAENIAPLLAELGANYTHLLAAATTSGKDILPRAAALLDVAQISDVVAIDSADTFVRPIYAGNALASEQSADAIKVLTIRATAFAAAAPGDSHAEIRAVDSVHQQDVATLVRDEIVSSERPELGAAKVVISGGRALQSRENFKILDLVADKLGAAVGASRAAVDEGFAPNDWQVGQTGKVVAPELYIACGISGAIQHLAGIKDSKVIVAINTDPDAPIFEVADYALVADLFEAVPALAEAL